MTHLERGIIFLSYDPERIIYDDACHLKKCCLNPVQKEAMTAVSKTLGKMYMVVDNLHFRNHVDQ